MKKIIAILLAFMVVKTVAAQQVLTMQEIQSAIQTNHPALKMLFGERYGERVKVYTIGNASREICAGPHVAHTSELGHFRIAKEEAVGAGLRRIKAVLE